MLGLVAAGAVLAALAFGAVPTDRSTIECHRYAAPSGRDTWRGSAKRPFRTVDRLARSLRAGQTGCLRGAFREDVAIRRGGRAGAPVTLTTDPDAGRRARLRGRLYIADTANHVTVQGLVLDGRPASAATRLLPSPSVSGDFARFVDNDVTNRNTGICFVLGDDDAGAANGTVIERNRIHHCGALPPTNHHHGIYVAVSRDALIRDNVIYANADRGVQLYPDARGTVIEFNVIDGNGAGVLFAGEGGYASSANVVRDNVITNSAVRFDIGAFWNGAVGVGNVVEGNCVWGGRLGAIERPRGFVERENVVANPRYVNRARGDFRLARGSPCGGKGPRTRDQWLRELLDADSR